MGQPLGNDTIGAWYTNWEHTDSVIDRAQVGADLEDIAEYLNMLKTNLEARGMTHGHTALIFKGPSNDLSRNYKAILRLLERIEKLKGEAKNSTTYQVALDDIRGTIRELPNPAAGSTWVSYFWLVFIIVILWIILVIWVMKEDY